MAQTFVVWWYRILLTITFGFGALCLGIALGQASVWLGLASSLPPAVLAVRAARASVRLSLAGVEVRGVWRTRRSGWDAVRLVRVTSGSSTGLPWRIPEFVLDQGTIRAEDVRALRQGGIPERVVEAANGFLAAEEAAGG